MPRIELEQEILDEDQDLAQRSTEVFDRVAFAQRALALVRPRATTVAICPGARRVSLQAGRQWGGEPGERWAILSLPRDASRRAIASAVLELGSTRSRPWALDVLLAGIAAPEDEAT